MFVHIPLFVMSIYVELQVYMFSDGKDMTKCQFLHHDDNDNDDDDVNDDAKVLAIPRFFSENSRANNKIIEAIFANVFTSRRSNNIEGR